MLPLKTVPPMPNSTGSIFDELFSSRYKSFIPEFDSFMSSLEKSFPLGMRLNTSLCKLDRFIKRFELNSDQYHLPISNLNYIEVDPEAKNWGGALEHHLGFYYIQALSSLLPVYALGLEEGVDNCVLDMCAAPGGKTTHMAQEMGQQGVLIANEPHLGRRRILKASLNRLGVKNTLVCGLNGQDLDYPKESFSKILLDGPCSSEGTLRASSIRPSKKKDKSYLQYNESFRTGLHKIQSELLEKAYELLKPGGTLIYSTCTYDPYENEAQVSTLVRAHSDMTIVPLGIDSKWDPFLCDGIEQYNEDSYVQNINLTKRIYPHKLNSIGFYVSKLIKR